MKALKLQRLEQNVEFFGDTAHGEMINVSKNRRLAKKIVLFNTLQYRDTMTDELRRNENERYPARTCDLPTLRLHVVEKIQLSSKVSNEGREGTIQALVVILANKLRDDKIELESAAPNRIGL